MTREHAVQRAAFYLAIALWFVVVFFLNPAIAMWVYSNMPTDAATE